MAVMFETDQLSSHGDETDQLSSHGDETDQLSSHGDETDQTDSGVCSASTWICPPARDDRPSRPDQQQTAHWVVRGTS